MKEKRKAYKDVKDQIEANKRYLKNNPDARERKKISTYKSIAKSFIKNYANYEELEEFKKIIEEKLKKILKRC